MIMPSRSEFDVVIVGSGAAGLTTALASARAGLRAAVLEKSSLIGGASCWSYGAVWLGANQQAASAGIKDERNAVADYMRHLGGGENTPARTDAIVNTAATLLSFLEDAGVHVDLMQGVNDILFGKAPGAAAQGRTLEPRPITGAALGELRAQLRTPPGDEWRVPKSIVTRLPDPAAVKATIAAAIAADQLAQGTSLVAQLLLALQPHQVPVLVEREVTGLLTEGGRVSGVRLADGSRLQARRAVMLAAGNYLSNPAMMATLEHLPDYRSWYPATHTGDALQLAGGVGAAVGITRNNLMVMLGFADPHDANPANAGAASVRDLPRAHTMIVNRAGERFGNEALFQELAPALRLLNLVTRQPKNLPCWMIFDTQYVNAWGFAGGPRGTVPEWVACAADLQSLASQIGIDAAGLENTAQRFNSFAASGVDVDFDRKPGWSLTPGSGVGKNASLGSIAVAPFYAVRLYPTLGGASAGLRADEHARVLNWQGQPVPGLYAAGDAAQHDEFGAGYQAGITFTSAMTFACLAVEHLRQAAIR
jgi:3-oxosteroid 1-dehydrogenase